LHYPAFFDRAGARTGFPAFFGSSLAARLPLLEFGSSISRWPEAALRGFLPFALAAGADCFSLARLTHLGHEGDGPMLVAIFWNKANNYLLSRELVHDAGHVLARLSLDEVQTEFYERLDDGLAF